MTNEPRTASYQDYLDHPEDYAKRHSPEDLNWGSYMDCQRLKDGGFKANRVSVLGDWDYAGRVE